MIGSRAGARSRSLTLSGQVERAIQLLSRPLQVPGVFLVVRVSRLTALIVGCAAAARWACQRDAHPDRAGIDQDSSVPDGREAFTEQ